MKLYFASALLVTALSFPAQASSIEIVDDMVTGAKGSTSVVTLGAAEPCAEVGCIDATGGDPKLNTAAAQQQAALGAMPAKKINFAFARKFPDPAVPIPAAPVAESADGSDDLGIPMAPADSGTVAAQPPVEQPTTQASMVPPAGDQSVAPVDPKAPVMPLANSELRESE